MSFVSVHLVGTGRVGGRWREVVALGVLLIVLGIAALVLAPAITLASMVLVGSLLMIVGILQAAHAIAFRHWGGFALDAVSGGLYALAGALIVAKPGASAEAITLLIAVVLSLGGLLRIVVASRVRVDYAIWLFFQGTLNLLLGLAIWQQWPVSGQWVIGLFLGLDLILNGWSLAMLGLLARRHQPGRSA